MKSPVMAVWRRKITQYLCATREGTRYMSTLVWWRTKPFWAWWKIWPYCGTMEPLPQRLPKMINIAFLDICPKVSLSFEGVLRAWGARAHVETIGNGYSFAHAKYGANL